MMEPDFQDLCERLSLTEIVRLQTMLSSALVRRFERPATVAFSDLAGSTAFAARFGDGAGRQLLQRHVDLVRQSLATTGGRVVDTAGDGAFLWFPTADAAVTAMIDLDGRIAIENTRRPPDQPMAVRIGIHHGPVLTDDSQITGDAVNFCARIAGSAEPGEIRLSRAAFLALARPAHRLKCRRLPPTVLKGVDRPVDLLVIDWNDRSRWVTAVCIDGGPPLPLPDQDVVTFGRLAPHEGRPGNDIVLLGADEFQTLQISRWHLELRRQAAGWLLRSTTPAPTSVNGTELARGQDHAVRPGDHVRVGNVVTLTFDTEGGRDETADAPSTIIPPDRA